ncbi:MAG: helix-turn-helix transcriptional regulator [Silvibacterium sp.]|nr:helix-turn-helix transcriptional regulator [Silvibacterium sp.]MBV8437306.1 helix-turn-helix transcriptional regulator [Silvibacterium sp.]
MSGSSSILQRDKLNDRGKPPSIEPVYSKTALSGDLIFESYVSSGVVEVPEMKTPAHVLILRTGSPSVVEWRSDGRDHRWEHAPGSVSLLPAGLRRAARVFRPLPGEASILQMRPDFVERGIGEIAKGGRVELMQRMDLSDAQIARLMESLRADVAAGLPSGALFGESIATALSAHIAQRYSTLTNRLETYRGGLARSRLNRVVEYIHAHLDNNLELSTLAEVAGLNVYHFARAFKQSTGESPHQYVLRRRIEHAKELLRQPQLSVIEASARTGFVDQSHFSKVFRRMVGLAPSEYRIRAL